jgi:cell division septum initiation protein DivIVA
MAIAINETYNLLRSKVKYGENSEEVDEQLNLLKVEFHQILHQNNLIIDNLLQ